MGPGLILAAGTLTFGNEWLQTGQVNWRVPIAAVLGAWIISMVDKMSSPAATGLGAMVLIGAAVTPINGKSPVQEITGTLPSGSRKKG